jgi:hypothetical protein
MSDKKGLLPIVSEGIRSAIQAELSQTPSKQYRAEILRRLSDGDNPVLLII